MSDFEIEIRQDSSNRFGWFWYVTRNGRGYSGYAFTLSGAKNAAHRSVRNMQRQRAKSITYTVKGDDNV